MSKRAAPSAALPRLGNHRPVADDAASLDLRGRPAGMLGPRSAPRPEPCDSGDRGARAPARPVRVHGAGLLDLAGGLGLQGGSGRRAPGSVPWCSGRRSPRAGRSGAAKASMMARSMASISPVRTRIARLASARSLSVRSQAWACAGPGGARAAIDTVAATQAMPAARSTRAPAAPAVIDRLRRYSGNARRFRRGPPCPSFSPGRGPAGRGVRAV